MYARLAAAALWFGAACCVAAQEQAAENISANARADTSAPPADDPPVREPDPLSFRVRGLFDIDLPRFDPPGTFRLSFNPRFADLIRRDYIRIPTGVRWAANDRLELYTEAEAYATHGLDDNTSDGYGIAEVRFGGRYLFPQWPKSNYETSVGLNIEIPVGNPPLDLTDGHNHFSPYFVVQRRLKAKPRWSVFGGMSLDFVTDSEVDGGFGRNTPRDDSVSLNGGAIYDLGQVKWTLQATYTNTLPSGGDEHFFTIRPSVLWFLPREYTFNSKTQWIVGFGVRSTWGPDGYEFSTSSRVRAEITFRQAMRRLRGVFDNRR